MAEKKTDEKNQEIQDSAESSGGAGKKKKKKKKKVKKVIRRKKKVSPLKLWTQEQFQNLREILGEFFSPEKRTRRMSRLFVFSGVTGVVSLIALITLIWTLYQGEPEPEKIEKEIVAEIDEDAEEEVEGVKASFKMGKFLIELRPTPGTRQVPGVVDMAEIYMVIECDAAESCQYVEENIEKARDQVTGTFTPMEKAEILSKSGKRKLKLQILKTLNKWIPEGKINAVHFASIIIG